MYNTTASAKCLFIIADNNLNMNETSILPLKKSHKFY